MTDCVFCAILDGSEAATFVYRDDLVAAFMDIQPVNPGHVLIVPNRHIARLADLDEETGALLFQAGQRLAASLRVSGLRCEGVNFFLADGAAAMQEVFHVHLHVFPRYEGDGFGLTLAEAYFTKPPRSALETTAVAIRAALGNAAAD